MPVLEAVALSLLLTAAAAPAAPAEAAHDLSRLAWLGGCWRSATGEPGSGEHWMPLAGGTLIGVSRTVRQGRTVAHEFLQIRAQADGRIAYLAHPSGQAPAAFPLVSLDAREAVFENPAHDFPTRIVYTRMADTALVVRIEGERGGAPRVIRFPMARVSCDSLRHEPGR